MFEANVKLPIGILRDHGLGVNISISQDLNLSAYTVVIKQGKLQHAAVYNIKFRMKQTKAEYLITFIIHQTNYEKSDRSRAFNKFTIACELDMKNAISAADIAFIMSSLTSAWLLSPLECSPQKQNG